MIFFFSAYYFARASIEYKCIIYLIYVAMSMTAYCFSLINTWILKNLHGFEVY